MCGATRARRLIDASEIYRSVSASSDLVLWLWASTLTKRPGCSTPNYFAASIDKVCRALDPEFRRVLEYDSDLTTESLREGCQKKTETWPEKGAGIIYGRPYPDIPPDDENALYGGWTVDPPKCHSEHLLATQARDRRGRRQITPTHYDLATTDPAATARPASTFSNSPSPLPRKTPPAPAPSPSTSSPAPTRSPSKLSPGRRLSPVPLA